MLNRPLYDALHAAFGSVGIVNEDEHADILPAPGTLLMWKVASSASGTRGEQYRVNCPFCGDTRRRLYVSYLSYARPEVNGTELPAGPLIAYCQNEHCISDRNNRDVLEGMIGRAMSGVQHAAVGAVSVSSPEARPADAPSDEVTLDGIRTWAPDYRPLAECEDPVVLDYVRRRGLTEDTVRWLRVGYGPIRSRSRGLLKNGVPWVMFPIVQNGRLAGLQARCPDVFMEEGDGMKYYIHPACRKAALLYNLDMARGIGVGVLCEGVFDVASVGRPGICSFGHTPSVIQRSLIASIGGGLIWLPDRDANAQCNPVRIAEDMTAAWNAAGVFRYGAHVVRLSGKDAGEMDRTAVWKEILSQVPEAFGEFLMKRVIDRL